MNEDTTDAVIMDGHEEDGLTPSTSEADVTRADDESATVSDMGVSDDETARDDDMNHDELVTHESDDARGVDVEVDADADGEHEQEPSEVDSAVARSQHNRSVVIISIMAVIVAVLFSAFVWPGWGMKHSSTSATSTQNQVVKPKIAATALPSDASQLVKMLPEAVGIYARGEVKPSQEWQSTSPIEEYTVIYSNGDTSQDITITFAQWAAENYAKDQYSVLLREFSDTSKAQGSVKVDGKTTGLYELHTLKDDAGKAVVIWQNDTVAFKAQGPTNLLNNFYAQFPY